MTAEDYRARHHRLPDPRHRLRQGAVQGRRRSMAISSIAPAARSNCRGDLRTQHCCPTTRSELLKMYVMERIDGIALLAVQPAHRVRDRRDPISPSRAIPGEGEECDEEAALLRAAHGRPGSRQLGDPNYIRKANALYHEFEEAGLNRQFGYSSPADIVNLSAVLLEQRGTACPDRDPLPERHCQRTAMDCQSLQQRIPRRAGYLTVRTAERAAQSAPVTSP